MRFRIRFLDGSADVIHEMHADARSVASAVSLVADKDWPPPSQCEFSTWTGARFILRSRTRSRAGGARGSGSGPTTGRGGLPLTPDPRL